jgi:serine/threonine protein kinase
VTSGALALSSISCSAAALLSTAKMIERLSGRLGLVTTTSIVCLLNCLAPELKYVSREAIDLVKKMLTYDPERRISAEDALKHVWIMKKAFEEIDNDATFNALTNLKNYNVEQKL